MGTLSQNPRGAIHDAVELCLVREWPLVYQYRADGLKAI